MGGTTRYRVAYALGVLSQGLVLGLLLALAILALSSWAGGLRAFRYEAF